MAIDMRDLMTMSDSELLELWRKQEAADRGSSPEQDALVAEIERRGLDL